MFQRAVDAACAALIEAAYSGVGQAAIRVPVVVSEGVYGGQTEVAVWIEVAFILATEPSVSVVGRPQAAVRRKDVVEAAVAAAFARRQSVADAVVVVPFSAGPYASSQQVAVTLSGRPIRVLAVPPENARAGEAGLLVCVEFDARVSVCSRAEVELEALPEPPAAFLDDGP